MTKKSEIYGEGYGSSHTWKHTGTAQVGANSALKKSSYICEECQEVFHHQYDMIPNIFQAMEHTGVAEECSK